MIIDANKLEPDKIHKNICIIGSGIGGSVLALELIQQGNTDLVIVESGSNQKDSGLVSHNSIGREFGLPVTRDIRIGGTSNLWAGVCSPLDNIDFEERAWIPYSGWPIKYDDLKPHYKAVAHYFNIFDFDLYDYANIYEKYSKHIKNLNIDESLVNFKMFQQYEPAINFSNKLFKAIKDDSKQSLLYNATALELVSKSKDEKTDYLICYSSSGKKIKVYADIFVIAAGALETPRLLLNSNGLGNSTNMVGKNLLDHPMGNFIQIGLKKPIAAQIFHRIKYQSGHRLKMGIRLNENVQRQKNLPNHNFYLIPSFKRGIFDESEKLRMALITIKKKIPSIFELMMILRNPNLVYQVLSYYFASEVKYKMMDFWFITEQVPNFNSKVDLSHEKDKFGYPKARIFWNLSRYDYDAMDRYFDLLKEIFSNSNFEFVYKKEELCWQDRFTSAAHHLGTTRMSATAKFGVVDVNQKVYGSKNVYVCDSSVFPTSGNANTSFSIAALGHRLSDIIDSSINY